MTARKTKHNTQCVQADRFAVREIKHYGIESH